MNKATAIATGLLTSAIIGATAGAGYIYTHGDTMIKKAAAYVSEQATKRVGTRIEMEDIIIGKIAGKTASDITVKNLVVYDKNSEVIAKAETAAVNFRLMDLYGDPIAAVDEIVVSKVEGNVIKRKDGTWNFEDLVSESGGETHFNANLKIEDGKVKAIVDDNIVEAEKINAELQFDNTKDIDAAIQVPKLKTKLNGNELKVEDIKANLEIDDASEVTADVKAKLFDTKVEAKGTINDRKQIINAKADNIDVKEYLSILPEGLIPEGVKILDGKVSNAKVKVESRGDNLTFKGSAKINDGRVMVEDTEIENINGSATFNDAEIFVDTDVSANEQNAHVKGSIRIDTEEPYFNVKASSNSFRPSAILSSIPVDSSAAFTAHLTGTVSKPVVEADIFSPTITYQGITADRIYTHMKYADNKVYLSDFKAEVFGGTVGGDAELKAQDLSYNAHIKTDSVEIDKLTGFIPAIAGAAGLVTADLGINGVSDDLNKLKVYGSAVASDIYYKNVPVTRVDISFFVEGKNLKIDYLSASMPNRGSIGVEGSIKDANDLDLKFYAQHVDMSFTENFIPQVQMSGLADFKGEILGGADNPNVDLKFTAVDMSKRSGEHFRGMLFDQPYDSIKFSAKGSLSEIEVSDFDLVKNGKSVWLAKGAIGLTGDKKISLRVDTVGARAEDIIKVIAPNQQLTGNVDNVITVTGTLDKPNVVGYVEFNRGSYLGFLVNRMAGDYYVEGDQVRLQDFYVNSPMVDMTLNGTIDRNTTAMDFVVAVNDINMHRLQGKFPENYPVAGHGKFEGLITGNLANPIFNGTLTADNLSFNEVEITNVSGHVSVNGNDILMENFSFNQGDGSYKVHGSVNYETQTMSAVSEVKNAGIAELCALANLKNNLLKGKINSNIRIGGTVQNPSLNMVGSISSGTFADCDIHDINLNINMLNHVIYINKLEGSQGATGQLNATGSANLNGPINMSLSAANLDLAMFTRAAGLDVESAGIANVEAKFGGTVFNPEATVEVVANGSVQGATFDLMRGNFQLKDWIIDVKELLVKKAIAEKFYQVSAKGNIPLVSLTTDENQQLSKEEQINLDISLDEADLSLLPNISKYVAWATGEMDGNLKITGTAGNPLINGKIIVNDGAAKFKAMSSPIEHMNITFAFTGNRMNIEEFNGNIGNGNYKLTGGLGFEELAPTDYNFNFTADKLEIKSDFYNGPLTMEFSVSEFEHRRLGKIPKIAGQVDFHNCLVSIPTLPDSEGELPDILLDIKVNLGDKVHLYTPYLFDMYVDGSAHFEGTTNRPIPSGSIYVKRGGTINYLKTVFKIREGEAHFNQIGSFFPSIIFAADAQLSRTKIFLNINGTLKDRSMRLTSSPEMTETEIMQLLTFRDSYQKGGDNAIEASDILMLGLQISFMSEIESAVRKTIGFDEFSISRGSGSAFDHHSAENIKNENEYHISMGKYITDKIMMKYTRGIGGSNINRYGIQYDLNDKISLTAESEKKDYIFGVEARWKF